MKNSEFCTAVAMSIVSADEFAKEHTLDLLHSFVVLDDGLDVLRFAYLPVREFLWDRTEYKG